MAKSTAVAGTKLSHQQGNIMELTKETIAEITSALTELNAELNKRFGVTPTTAARASAGMASPSSLSTESVSLFTAKRPPS
jgi:hypothetical protein